MDIFARIADFEKTTTLALANAVGDCDYALDELDAGKREWPAPKATPAPAPSASGNKKAPKGKEKPRVTNARTTRRLRDAWTALKVAIETHETRERDKVFPLCELVAADLERKEDLRALVKEMLAEHAEVRKLLSRVRVEAAAVDPVRDEFHRMASLVDEHMHKTEGVIFPEALGDFAEEASVLQAMKVRQRGAEDVARGLRKSRPRPEPEEEEEEAPSGFMAWLGKYIPGLGS